MFDVDSAAVTPLEVKFASDPATGEFEGYGAVYGTQDSHGDLIVPGAFTQSLSTRGAQGRTLPMYAQHGPYVGGDHLPVGVWRSVAEDERGLKVAGKISGMDTERGRTVHSLVKDGALRGLSIEFSVPKNGAVYGKTAGEPKRTIKTANLFGISLVADPSHPGAGVASIKSAAGGLLSLREFEARLREAPFNLSRSQAAHVVERGFKSLPRDEVEETTITPEVRSALHALRAAISVT